MASETLFFGHGFETEDEQGVFSRLSRMIMNNEVRIGGDAGPDGPDGGEYARLTPTEIPPYIGSVAMRPSIERSDQESLTIAGSLQ